MKKDFGMVSDMGNDEQDDVKTKYRNARWYATNKEPAEESSNLAAIGAVLVAMTNAAERSGVLETHRLDNGSTAVDLKSYRHAAWRAAVLQDANLLAEAPEEVRADRDLIMAALPKSCGRALAHAAAELHSDRELVLEAARCGGSLEHAADSLKGDRAFVAEVAAVNGAALRGASDQLRGDQAFMLELAGKGCGAAFEGAHGNIRGNREFLLKALQADPTVYKHAQDELKEDRNFALAAAQVNGGVLQYMPNRFQADKEIVSLAVAQDASSVVFAHTSRRVELGISVPWDSAKTMKEQYDMQALPDNTPVMCGMTPQAAKEDIASYGLTIRVQRMVQFSALSVMTANMGQGNYIASNSYLDKLPSYERPEIDSVTIMWGAVGAIGMRWKAFASQDFLNANPEALMSILDARKVLCITMTKMDPPEWYAASFFDEYSRQSMLAPTAGQGSGGGWRPSEDAGMPGVHGYGPSPVDKITYPSPAKELIEEVARLEQESSGPLGGWSLLFNDEPPIASACDSVKAAPLPIRVGTRVRLVGMASKNGKTGVVLKKHAADKWKVQLYDGSGNAILREHNLEGLHNHNLGDATADLKLKDLADQKKTSFAEKRDMMREMVAVA